MRIKKITIDKGETFEGTLQQFRDCFFENADEETIRYFCQKELDNSEVVFEYEDEA